MEVGEIIKIWEAKDKVKEAWEKEGHQFFISEDKDGWFTTLGVLCGKKDEISYEIMEEIRNDIYSSLELLPTRVTVRGEKYITWAIDITDSGEREIRKIKEELERDIREFNKKMIVFVREEKNKRQRAKSLIIS